MRKSAPHPRAFFYLAALITTILITFFAVFSTPASAETTGGNQYVLTVTSCTHWKCNSGGAVACPGTNWVPPGC